MPKKTKTLTGSKIVRITRDTEEMAKVEIDYDKDENPRW